MRKFFLLSLIIISFIGCSNEHKIFDSLNPEKSDYKLYIIPISNSQKTPREDGNTYIKEPIVIENQNTLLLMKKEWRLEERDIPKEKNILYTVHLYNKNKKVFTTWLDEEFKTLIWEDQLLRFNDSLLFKHKNSFRYLKEHNIRIAGVENARKVFKEIKNVGGILKNKSEYGNHWLKYEGTYSLLRLRDGLEPIPQIGKLRDEINDDFFYKKYELLNHEFIDNTDSMRIKVSSNLNFVKYIPSQYKIENTFNFYENIKFSCIGLTKNEIRTFAKRHNAKYRFYN